MDQVLAYRDLFPDGAKENWYMWKIDLYSGLEAQNAAFVGILEGRITAPTEPAYEFVTEEEAEIECYRDTMSVAESATFQASNCDRYSSSQTWHPAPKMDAIKSKMNSLNGVNDHLRSLYHTNLALFTTCESRIWLYLTLCVNRKVREFLLSDGDPNLDFETLRTMRERPYPLNIGQCLKAWTELRYTGNNAAGYVRRFQRAKREFEARA
ncbi:hypothetical protein N7452_007946 [Penicillium brevicompactum]|uniref:Uncharacterized protein n=1 Tax=Penicillium brevicompactum TaxID=5074 RepID=A0A9W9QGF6_PENBR|nr:hypothetical protein N7452_007946 [Penicillium brevicompactum]